MTDASIPEAGSPPESRRTRTVWVVIAVLLLLVALCAGVTTIAGPPAIKTLREYAAVFRISYTFTDVWTGFESDGSTLVITGSDLWGVPRVFAVEMGPGDVHHLDGWRLLAFDADSGTAWVKPEAGLRPLELARIGSAAAEKRAALDGMGDWTDGPAPTLYSWRLDGRRPSRVTSSAIEWGSRPGPAGSSVRLTVEPEKGACPRSLCFVSKDGTRTPDVSSWPLTVIPVGWSASGRYYAVFETVSKSDLEAPSCRVDVLDPRDGSLVATATFAPRLYLPDLSGPIWDEEDDILYWQESVEKGAPRSGLVGFDPRSRSTRILDLGGVAPRGVFFSGPRRFSSIPDTDTLVSLGGAKREDVIRFDLWSMHAGKPRHEGSVSWGSAKGPGTVLTDLQRRPVVRQFVFGPEYPEGSPMRSDFRILRGSEDASCAEVLLDTRDFPPIE